MKKHTFGHMRDRMHGQCVWTGKPTAKGIDRGRLPRAKEAALSPFAQIDPFSRGSHSELRQHYFSWYCGISVLSTSSRLLSYT